MAKKKNEQSILVYLTTANRSVHPAGFRFGECRFLYQEEHIDPRTRKGYYLYLGRPVTIVEFNDLNAKIIASVDDWSNREHKVAFRFLEPENAGLKKANEAKRAKDLARKAAAATLKEDAEEQDQRSVASADLGRDTIGGPVV